MSKFTDRLKRLHASRVRALDETGESDQKRVFHADADAEAPSADRPPVDDTPKEDVEPSPARLAVREQLRRGERLKSGGTQRRNGRRKLNMRRAPEGPSVEERSDPEDELPSPSRTARPSTPENRVGERLADLRAQIEALLEVGAADAALPMLHEMLALSPANPYPLGILVRYWRSTGDETLAQLYEARLRKTAPY